MRFAPTKTWQDVGRAFRPLLARAPAHSRYRLNGVMAEGDAGSNTTRLVATDGHSLWELTTHKRLLPPYNSPAIGVSRMFVEFDRKKNTPTTFLPMPTETVIKAPSGSTLFPKVDEIIPDPEGSDRQDWAYWFRTVANKDNDWLKVLKAMAQAKKTTGLGPPSVQIWTVGTGEMIRLHELGLAMVFYGGSGQWTFTGRPPEDMRREGMMLGAVRPDWFYEAAEFVTRRSSAKISFNWGKTPADCRKAPLFLRSGFLRSDRAKAVVMPREPG